MVFDPERERRHQRNRETEVISPGQQMFADLCNPVLASSVTPERVDALRGTMRQELAGSSPSFEQLLAPDMQHILQEYELHHLTSGKGLALATFFDGVSGTFTVTDCPKSLLFRSWAQSVSCDLPKLQDRGDYSRRRGVEQVAANTLAFASGAITAETYLQDLKWRIGAYFEKRLAAKEKSKKINLADSEKLAMLRSAYNIPLPGHRKVYSGTARISPEGIIGFWGQLKTIPSLTLPEARQKLDQSPYPLLTLLGNDKN